MREIFARAQPPKSIIARHGHRRSVRFRQGFLIAGVRGATVATIGIFAPAFLFVALSGLIIPKIRKSKIAASMLDGVVGGSLALMGVVTWQLGRAAIIDIPTALITLLSAALLLLLRVNSAWLILAAAIFGWLYHG